MWPFIFKFYGKQDKIVLCGPVCRIRLPYDLVLISQRRLWCRLSIMRRINRATYHSVSATTQTLLVIFMRLSSRWESFRLLLGKLSTAASLQNCVMELANFSKVAHWFSSNKRSLIWFSKTFAKNDERDSSNLNIFRVSSQKGIDSR